MNTLICVIGPSGCGKSTRVSHYIKNNKDANLLISDTTRPIRPNEKDKVDYNFLSLTEFNNRKHIESIAYNDHLYGLSQEEVDQKRASADITFFVCDIEGYHVLKNIYNNVNIYSIYIKMPSSICIQNLRNRDVDENKIKDRIFYDCMIDAYTLDSIVKFDSVIRFQKSWNFMDRQFENIVKNFKEYTKCFTKN